MTEDDRPVAKGNVIDLPGLSLPYIGIAATCGQGNKISGSRNDIWYCPAYDKNQQQLMLYVKIGLAPRAIMVEMLAAQIAQAIGLPTPDPYLVTVKSSHVGKTGTKSLLAFGTLDLSTRAMARPARDVEMLFSLLEKLKLADLACAFDEWIANDVRGPSDILICPENFLYLIDHEAAMAEGLDPGAALTNWIALRLMERLADSARHQLLRRLRARLAAFKRVSFETVPLNVGYMQDGAMFFRQLADFLVARLQHLDRLLSQRIVPEQLYLSPQSDLGHKDEAGQA